MADCNDYYKQKYQGDIMSEIEKVKENNSVEIELFKISGELATSPEYNKMLEHINKNMPLVRRDSENFYKSASQFKNVTLDVTELTTMGSLKHVLAVLDRTRMALEESYVSLKRKQIELKQKTLQHDSLEEGYEKELLWVDIVEINTQMGNIENSIKGALRKASFFSTQYDALMQKLGKEEITEEDYEVNEARHHVMTAMKQALIAARTRGGMIDEGNHIYLFDMGINGAVAQAEIIAYLQMEEEMLIKGEIPTHEMTIKWLEACADKFAKCGTDFAELRGFIPLDKKSLIKEASNEND
jgi:hypothetical protein